MSAGRTYAARKGRTAFHPGYVRAVQGLAAVLHQVDAPHARVVSLHPAHNDLLPPARTGRGDSHSFRSANTCCPEYRERGRNKVRLQPKLEDLRRAQLNAVRIPGEMQVSAIIHKMQGQSQYSTHPCTKEPPSIPERWRGARGVFPAVRHHRKRKQRTTETPIYLWRKGQLRSSSEYYSIEKNYCYKATNNARVKNKRKRKPNYLYGWAVYRTPPFFCRRVFTPSLSIR